MTWTRAVCSILLGLVATELQAAQQPRLPHRWVYLSTNMLVEENVETDLALLRRAAEAGSRRGRAPPRSPRCRRTSGCALRP